MAQMEDVKRRLDLDAPLLSVRRFASEPEPGPKPSAKARGNPNPRRSALPFYKSDLKSGPIRDPGAVPFVWERTPGHPKDGPRSDSKLSPESEEEGEDEFCDALETLSRTESFFMNCSVSGLSEAPGEMEASGSFSTDPGVRDFMMGRFLPAAKAVAAETPHSSSRKPPASIRAREPGKMVGRTESGEQRRVRFPNGADFAHEEEGTSCSCAEDGGEEEYHDKNRPFLSKGCGLIPKFCLLNPIPGMKVSGQRLRPDSVRRVRGAGAEEEGLFCVWNPPGSGQRLSQNSVRKVGGAQIKKMEHGSLVKAEEEYSWEAIYKHKLLNGNTPAQEEDISKLTESNHHTYLSDSVTTDQLSPQYYSNTSAVTPYRNEPSQSPFHEGKGFLGIPRSPRRDNKGSRTHDSDSFEKDSENCWLMTPHHTVRSRSGSSSPAVERTLRVDTVHRPETSISKLSLQGTSLDDKDLIRSADNDSAIGVQTPGFGESLVLETHDEDALLSKVTEIVETRLTVSPENSVCDAKEENSDLEPSDKDYIGMLLKENNQVKNDADSMSSLLPPPLPNTPSESWLKRALPSVSSMKPSAKSFLDIHVQARKQVRISSLTVPKKDFHIKHRKVQRGQIRFADMLAEPLSPQAEI